MCGIKKYIIYVIRTVVPSLYMDATVKLSHPYVLSGNNAFSPIMARNVKSVIPLAKAYNSWLFSLLDCENNNLSHCCEERDQWFFSPLAIASNNNLSPGVANNDIFSPLTPLLLVMIFSES